MLDQGIIKELLSHAVHYGIPRAEANDPGVTEEHERAEGEIIMQAQMLAEMKKNYQNLDAECHIYAAHQKDFVLLHNLLYLKVMPKRSNEDVLVFVVPGLKRQAVIDGCHHYLGHQGRDHTLSLLKERFWWPGMAQRMMLSIRNCEKCRIFEAKPQIPPMEPILCTKPLDLVHIDYVSIVKNVLVVEDHFTCYTQVYVTNNHTAHTTAHILYNEFFSVFGFHR